MEDRKIIDLFLQRDERALSELQDKYGTYSFSIARNILSADEDAEECINDALRIIWQKIPPAVPVSMKAFFGKIVRDVCISRYRSDHAQKRNRELDLMLEELEECLPSGTDTEKTLEDRRTEEIIVSWLGELPAEERVLFIKRYYFGITVRELAEEFSCSGKKMAKRMYILRQKLKKRLVSEEVEL